MNLRRRRCRGLSYEQFEQKSEMDVTNNQFKVDNRLLFSQWLSYRYVKKTREKYEECVENIDVRARKVEGFSLLAEQTLQGAVAIVRGLESKTLLNKDERKASVLYLSFLAQKREASESETARLNFPVKPNKIDFEKWLSEYRGFSYAQCKKYIDDVEKISKSLYEVRTLLDLQIITYTLLPQLNKSLKRVIDYFFAYLCFCLPKEGKSSDVGDRAIKIAVPQATALKSFEEWCLDQGLTRVTIASMKVFVESLSKYAAFRGLSPDFENCTPLEKLKILFHIFSQSESYVHLLSEFKYHGYIDRYSLYLLSIIPEKQVKMLVGEKQVYVNLPVLIADNGKQIGKLFSRWLKDNGICSDGSARTFVSSLYDCEKIASSEFNSSLFCLENKFQASWTRLQIIDSPNFIGRLYRPLWLYLQFLSSYHVVSNAQFDADKQRFIRLLNKKYNGAFKLLRDRIEPSVLSEWLNEYGDIFPYSNEQLVSVLKELTIYDSNEECYYTKEMVISEEAKIRVKEYIGRAWTAGSPIIDYSQIIKSLSSCLNGVTVEILRQYLALDNSGEYVCESKHLRALKVPKQNRGDIAVYVCNLLRNIGKPITKKELTELASTLSEKSVRIVLGGDSSYGINVGIINPKGAKNKIFHADIINLTKKEKATIIGLINGELLRNVYATASRLYSLVKAELPYLFTRYDFLTRSALYGVLRYKFSQFFTFNISCVTYNRQINIPSIFVSFCEKHNKFKLYDLSKIKVALGAVGIPFEHIYAVAARISRDSFIRRESLNFDVAWIDKVLLAHCPQKIMPINLFTDYNKLPQVKNAEWNIFLLEHYLSYHSKKLSLSKRNFAKGGCYGLIVRKGKGSSDFDTTIIEYLSSRKMEYSRENILSLLFEEGIIAARRYENIDSIIDKLTSKK